MSSTVAFGQVPTTWLVKGLTTSKLRSPWPNLPATRIVSLRITPMSNSLVELRFVRGIIQRQVEGAEVAQAIALRQSLQAAVDDHRHLLLGHAAMGTQGARETGKVMLRGTGADGEELLGNDDHIADPILGQLELLAARRAIDREFDAR